MWDESRAGSLAADAIAPVVKIPTGSSGKIAIVEPQDRDAIIADRISGFEERMKQSYPNLSTKVAYAPDSAEGLVRISAELISDPTLVGVFYPTTSWLAVGATEAIRNFSKAGVKVAIAGSWSGAINWAGLSDSQNWSILQQTTFVLQDPYVLGYDAVRLSFKPDKDYASVQAATVFRGDDIRRALTDWSQVSGTGLVPDPRVLSIIYATNRTMGDQDKQEFTGQFDNQVHYGAAYVRVPESHRFGQPPNWSTNVHIPFFGGEAEDQVFVIKRKEGLQGTMCPQRLKRLA
jgi:hypothetical protein